jgi:hypothetical protein
MTSDRKTEAHVKIAAAFSRSEDWGDRQQRLAGAAVAREQGDNVIRHPIGDAPAPRRRSDGRDAPARACRRAGGGAMTSDRKTEAHVKIAAAFSLGIADEGAQARGQPRHVAQVRSGAGAARGCLPNAKNLGPAD